MSCHEFFAVVSLPRMVLGKNKPFNCNRFCPARFVVKPKVESEQTQTNLLCLCIFKLLVTNYCCRQAHLCYICFSDVVLQIFKLSIRCSDRFSIGGQLDNAVVALNNGDCNGNFHRERNP